ncbi:winged helix-turn-helix domain-containing protein [Actinomadura atramentaria]|uniref:winged helix-turn-helix domain-containing protein n=1 Tax=Actinomadura atramentaria TaxID=1990 RepID=UPI0003600008|nr:winged helix-turn-helix domain-containing protein [Actinomadura atramentaria]
MHRPPRRTTGRRTTRRRRSAEPDIWQSPWPEDHRRGRMPEAGRAAGLAASLTALAVARRYGQWLSRSPDTRGLASGLVALYPVGEIAHRFTAADALQLAAFAPPAALAAWVGTYKRHRSVRYSAALTATFAGVPVWLATAAHLGVTNLSTLLGYSVAASATWSAYTWSDVLTQRRAHAERQAAWQNIADLAGLQGSRLVATHDTRVGVRFKVDIRATGKTAKFLASSDLDQRIAQQYSIGTAQVRVTEDAKHAGIVWITVQLRDLWAEACPHPALTGETVRRSVMDGPFVVGTDPENGDDLAVTVFDHKGGRHTQVFATNGGGKTVFLSNLVEQATACDDVLTMAIDLGKGTIPSLWKPALDAAAGIGEEDRALAILEWACLLIEIRSLTTGGANHRPTPTDPVLLLVIDEIDTLVGVESPVAHLAKPMVNNIHRRGRSAGVELVTAGQRNVVQYTGSKDGKANAPNKVILRVSDTDEMTSAMPDWMQRKMPDMSTYAPDTDGVALLVAGGRWTAGRIRDLSDVDAVRALAASRGTPVARLAPDVAAQLPGYAERGHEPVTVPATAPEAAAEQRTAPPDPSVPDAPPARPAGQTGGTDRRRAFGIDPDDQGAVDRLAGELVAEVEARLRDLPEPPDKPVPLADLMNAKATFDAAESNPPATNRALGVPDRIARPILALLTARAGRGAQRAELVNEVGKSKSTVASWLAVLRDQGVITTHGEGKAARYYLPQHAPADVRAHDESGDAE